jgi:hypothetical protein
MAGRAEMRFVGDKKLVCDLLPAVFALDPAIRQEIFVGRDGKRFALQRVAFLSQGETPLLTYGWIE